MGTQMAWLPLPVLMAGLGAVVHTQQDYLAEMEVQDREHLDRALVAASVHNHGMVAVAVAPPAQEAMHLEVLAELEVLVVYFQFQELLHIMVVAVAAQVKVEEVLQTVVPEE